MDADGLPLVGPGVDYTKVEAIHQKRTIAFINHFITHTASFLNRFSGVCEEKLEHLSNRIQQLEITMNLLEAKLSSVPGLENVTVAASSTTATTSTAGSTPTATTAAPASSAPAAAQPTSSADDAAAAAAPPEETKPTMTVSQHPTYARFFKMQQVGVPSMGVKTKMAAEGLNPDLLDTPDAPAPDGGGSSAGGGGGNKSDSDDFSDNDDDDENDNETSDEDDFSD